ncbi:RhuM family protein [Deltaproteobacteria bacterium TL4]
MKQEKHTEIVIYQAKNGAIEFQADTKAETLWATQAQMADVFDTTPQNITLHLKNIYRDEELSEQATCKESLQVQREGNRTVRRKQKMYNLDVIISVGYRINSKKGTKFRQWATQTLRQHIWEGYTLNPERLAQNYDTFLRAVEEVKKLLPTGGTVDTQSVLELINLFANTWFSLDAYDKSALPTTGATQKQVEFTAQELTQALAELKQELKDKGEATDLFGAERSPDSVGGIVGNVLQSFGGEDLYPTLEEKAAHLLYFLVKNHPFTDGNKRSGAFAFVWFLKQAGLLNPSRLSPEALTALTLLVAESNPKDKDRMVGLVLLLLRK